MLESGSLAPDGILQQQAYVNFYANLIKQVGRHGRVVVEDVGWLAAARVWGMRGERGGCRGIKGVEGPPRGGPRDGRGRCACTHGRSL